MSNNHNLAIKKHIIIQDSIDLTFLDSIDIHSAILESTVRFTYSMSVNSSGPKRRETI